MHLKVEFFILLRTAKKEKLNNIIWKVLIS